MDLRNGYFLSQKISTIKFWKSRSFLQLFCLDSQDFFFVCVTFKRCWSLNSRSLQISLHHGVVDVEKGDRCPKKIDKRGKHPLFQKLTNAYFFEEFCCWRILDWALVNRREIAYDLRCFEIADKGKGLCERCKDMVWVGKTNLHVTTAKAMTRRMVIKKLEFYLYHKTRLAMSPDGQNFQRWVLRVRLCIPTFLNQSWEVWILL